MFNKMIPIPVKRRIIIKRPNQAASSSQDVSDPPVASSSTSTNSSSSTSPAASFPSTSTAASSSSRSSSISLNFPDCTICYDPCDKKNQAVSCPRCEAIICQNCLLQHIGINKVFPACISCNFQFDEIILRKVLPAKAVAQIRKFIKIVLLDQEKSKFPEDMEQLNEELAREQRRKDIDDFNNGKESNIVREQRLELDRKIRTIDSRIKNGNYDTGQNVVYDEVINKLNAEKSELLPKRNALLKKEKKLKEEEGIEFLERFPNEDLVFSIKSKSKTHSKVIPCGFNECKGFLSQHWKCMLCDKKKCNKCHEFIEEKGEKGEKGGGEDENVKGHECDPNSVASVEMYMKDTKPCPKCGLRIHREYGCDHMWCTVCHTSFNYATGMLIEDKNNTNEHYKKWLKEQKKDTHSEDVTIDGGSGGCNEPQLISASRLADKLIAINNIPVGEVGEVRKPASIEEETDMMLLLTFRDLIDPGNSHFSDFEYDGFLDFMDRRDFLKGKINEEQLAHRAFLKYRKQERRLHNRQIANTLKLAGIELFHEIEMAKDATDVLVTLKSIKDLVLYINKSFKELNIALDYNSYPFINEKFFRVDYGKSDKRVEAKEIYSNDYNKNLIIRRKEKLVRKAAKEIKRQKRLQKQELLEQKKKQEKLAKKEAKKFLCDSYKKDKPCEKRCICECPCHFIFISDSDEDSWLTPDSYSDY